MSFKEYLLGYEPELYQAGSVVFAWPETLLLIAVAAATTLIAWLGYKAWRTRGTDGLRTAASVALRSAAVALIIVLLAQPVLVVEVEEPVRATVAVLVDDTLSMNIRDFGDSSRADRLRALLREEETGLVATLGRSFDVALTAVGASSRLLEDVESLEFDANVSRTAAALVQTLDRFGSGQLAGIVLLSDGGHEGQQSLDTAARRLRNAGVPVHTVPILPSPMAPDLELTAVNLPPRLLAGERAHATVVVRHTGLTAQNVRVRAESAGILLAQQQMQLADSQRPSVVSLGFEPQGSGMQPITFSVELASGQTTTAAEGNLHNNRIETLLSVDPRPIAVLHYEGEPRFEVKFLRRAVFDDPTIRLTSLVRTAENKYYRLGVESKEQLQDGFPRKAPDLFDFDVVVLGSVSDEQLDTDQQQLLARFVGERGGGLIALGGHFAFARGGYKGQPLADLLPVVLPQNDEESRTFLHRVKLVPTAAAARHPLTRLGSSASAEAFFAGLPALTMVNPISRLKPGATLLLEGLPESATAPGTGPLSAYSAQRYGVGRVAAFAVRDTWRWQINEDISVEDRSHETFWRQTLRWLAAPARRRVEVAMQKMQSADSALLLTNQRGPRNGTSALAAGENEFAVGEIVTIEARFLGRDYEPLAVTEPTATVISPLGDIDRLVLTPVANRPGLYRTSLKSAQDGIYELRIEGRDPAAQEPAENSSAPPPRLSTTTWLQANASGREYFGAHQGRRTLDEVARQSGGQMFDVLEGTASPDDLVASLRSRGATRTIERSLPLWNVPLFLVILLLLLATEWLLRRQARLR